MNQISFYPQTSVMTCANEDTFDQILDQIGEERIITANRNDLMITFRDSFNDEYLPF